MAPPVENGQEIPTLEQSSKPEVDRIHTDEATCQSPPEPTNSRPRSLLAHESAIEYDSFSYVTLPNSAPPDVLARWRHMRIHGGAHGITISERGGVSSWEDETCCKKLLRRRIILFLVLLLTGVVMASVTVATVWITESNKHKYTHSKLLMC